VSESYNTVVTALQEADKLDNYERVVSSLINEETKLIEKGQINPNKHDEKAFYSNSRGRGQRGRFRGKGRGQYNRNDANSNNDNKNQSTTKFEGNCRYCNIYGHKESDCRNKQRDNNQKRGNYRGSYRGSYRGGYNRYNNNNQANYTEKDSKEDQQAFIANSTTSSNDENWVMDSGASHHMTSNRDLFTTFTNFDKPTSVELGNNHIIYAEGRGTIQMELEVKNRRMNGTLTDVLYVPKLRKNLFSIGKAISKDLTLQIQQNEATIYNRRKPVMQATKRNSLYFINGHAISHQANVTTTSDIETQLWHRRLGHIGTTNLEYMIKNNSVNGLPKLTGSCDFCESCAINKSTRLPFSKSTKSSNGKLNLIHTDLCGPMKNPTNQGNLYFITFIDDYSRKAYVYFLRYKNEAFEKFQEFRNYVENQTGLRIKTLRSDRGGEYVNG
jgi:hypothetical protein